MASITVPEITLHDGATIPQLGFGVFQIPPAETAEAVTRALQAGYRHIDTAKAYGNEAEVTDGIRAAGLTHDDVFVTTKCFNDDHGYDNAIRAGKESLSKLEMEFIDLYLIHWPVPSTDKYVETWQGLIELQKQGLVRSIGVSNFQPDHLDRIIRETGVTPVVNQIELHPRFQQRGLREHQDELKIITEAWSPLAQGAVLDDETINEIAREHDKTAGQVVLRWHTQIGNIVFPKSVTPERIEENFDIFDFTLSAAEIERIDELDAGDRIGPDPDTFVRP